MAKRKESTSCTSRMEWGRENKGSNGSAKDKKGIGRKRSLWNKAVHNQRKQVENCNLKDSS
jgi:hypothetical protein